MQGEESMNTPSRRHTAAHAIHSRLARGDTASVLLAAAAAVLGAALMVSSAYFVHPLALPMGAAGVALIVAAFFRPHIAVAAALVMAPLELFSLPLPTGAVTPSEAALVLVGLAWVARALAQPGTTTMPSLRDAPIIVLLGAVAAGIVIAADPSTVVRVLVLWTLFYLVYLETRAFTPNQMRFVVAAFTVGAGVLGAIGAASYVQSGGTELFDGGTATGERITGSFADPNYFASFLSLALLPGIALVIADFRRSAWLLPFLVTGLAGLTFSLSRGAIAGFAIGLLLLFAWRRARRLLILAVPIVAVLTLVGANPVVESEQFRPVEQRLSTLSDPGQDSNRPRIWATAVQIALDHPFFGIGVNEFPTEASQRGLTENGNPLENAHSIPLSLAAETGLIGLAAFVALIVQLGRRGLTALRPQEQLNRALALGFSAGLLALIVQGLTAAQIRTNIITGSFFVVAGMLTGLADRARPPASTREAMPAEDLPPEHRSVVELPDANGSLRGRVHA
jgi:O-antigen ligase